MTTGPTPARPARRCRRRPEPEGGQAMPTLTVVDPAGDDREPAGRKDFPVLSIFDPVFIGIDEFGHPVHVPLMYRNMLVGGEPGSGKSVLLNLIAAHGALDPGCGLVLLDGKWVELGQWRACADVFVGPNIAQASNVLR